MSARYAQSALIAVLVALFSASCGKAPQAAQRSLANPAEGAATPKSGADTPLPKHPRYGEAAVYVDGEPRAVMRVMELPPGLQPVAQPSLGGSVERYLLARYLDSVGVDVSKVRAVHVYGGQHVSPLTGDDVRSHASELSFDFGGGDRGKPRIHYCDDIHPPVRIDMISALAVYVDKPPPLYHPDPAGGFLAFSDGVPIDGIPYAPREQTKGTRVYVDGVLVGAVHRRRLPDKVVAGRSGQETLYSLDAYLDSIGVDSTRSRAIDLISGDDLVERLDASQWAETKKSFTFAIPAHSQGQIVIQIPSTVAERAKISAVQIFSKLEPPKRWIAPAEYVAMGDGPRGGNDTGQNDMP